MSINNDQSRFHKIVKGKIRQNLKKFINNESLIGKIGKNKVSIPIPNINLPRFKFDDQQSKGIGQGDGEIGDTLGQGQPGKRKAGQ